MHQIIMTGMSLNYSVISSSVIQYQWSTIKYSASVMDKSGGRKLGKENLFDRVLNVVCLSEEWIWDGGVTGVWSPYGAASEKRHCDGQLYNSSLLDRAEWRWLLMRISKFLAATAALEVQMLVCVSVCLSVTLATTVLKLKTVFSSEGLLKDFWRTSGGLLKDFWRTLDFRLYGLQNLIVYKSQPPGLPDLFYLVSAWSTACNLVTFQYSKLFTDSLLTNQLFMLMGILWLLVIAVMKIIFYFQ